VPTPPPLRNLHAGRKDDGRIKVRQSKYLNSQLEQDYRNIKRRIKLMTGFKSFRRTKAILIGIELIHMGNFSIPVETDCQRRNSFICWLPE